MKIVCDACAAKYAISDDKVRGKVFKIRCKKCSNVIVVRGASEPEPPPQDQVTHVQHDGDDAAGGEAVWHLVIDQQQVGPMTIAEVEQRFAAGEVTGETFAWREELADWLPLAQLDVFAALVGATTAHEPAFPTPLEHAVADADMRARAESSHDLFGSAPVERADASAAAQRLRGERNESSVLFSLNNLANIASHHPAPAASAAISSMPQTAAGGEGSGLIDIRSMASAYLGTGGGVAVARPTAGIGSLDDLPVFGGGGFSEPAVLVPTPARPTTSKMLYAMIGAVALLAVAAAVMIVMLLHREPAPTQVAAATPAIATQPTTPTPPTTPPEPAPAPEPSKHVDVVAPAPSAPAPAPVRTPPSHAPPHRDARAPSVAAPPPPPAPAKPAKTESSECDDVSCVVDSESACCVRLRARSHPASEPKKVAVNPDLPETLDASMITASMANVKARVSACGAKAPTPGKVKVHLKVGGDGRVATVTIESTSDAALGTCVAAAVQKATFPKTQNGRSFGIPYSF